VASRCRIGKMESENTGGNGQKAATGKGRMPYLVLGIIIVVAIAAFAFYSAQAPSRGQVTTTSAATTTVAPPGYSFFQNLTLIGTVLSGLPASAFTQYYVYVTGNSSQVQYAYNFTNPFFQPTYSAPSNYTFKVPPQYANLTSPFAVIVNAWRSPSNAAAVAQHNSKNAFLCSEINASHDEHVTTSAFGSSSTYCSGIFYGGQAEAVTFVTGNYTVEVVVIGVLNKLGSAYLNATASHIYSIVSRQPI
jgi:hypothetical protein